MESGELLHDFCYLSNVRYSKKVFQKKKYSKYGITSSKNNEWQAVAFRKLRQKFHYYRVFAIRNFVLFALRYLVLFAFVIGYLILHVQII